MLLLCYCSYFRFYFGLSARPLRRRRRPLLACFGSGSARANGPRGMTLRFVLMVNKQGQTRLAQYYERQPMGERCALEAEVIRKCLSRTETQCSFFEYRGYKVVYRRYASLFFIVGVEGEDENELSILEFIHALVETLDRYFECAPAGKSRGGSRGASGLAPCAHRPLLADCPCQERLRVGHHV